MRETLFFCCHKCWCARCRNREKGNKVFRWCNRQNGSWKVREKSWWRWCFFERSLQSSDSIKSNIMQWFFTGKLKVTLQFHRIQQWAINYLHLISGVAIEERKSIKLCLFFIEKQFVVNKLKKIFLGKKFFILFWNSNEKLEECQALRRLIWVVLAKDFSVFREWIMNGRRVWTFLFSRQISRNSFSLSLSLSYV